MIRYIEVFLLLGAGLLLTSCGIIKGSSNPAIDEVIKTVNESVPVDSPLEEMIEDVIETSTGISIDLTPASPEND